MIFLTLGWYGIDMQSVETVLQILNFDLVLASNVQYGTLVMLGSGSETILPNCRLL